eukprot:765104_1
MIRDAHPFCSIVGRFLGKKVDMTKAKDIQLFYKYIAIGCSKYENGIGLFWSLEDNIFKWSSASCIYRHEKTMFVWNRGSGYEVGEYLDKQFVYDLEKWRDKTLYQYFGDSIESKEMKLSFGFIRE